VSLLQGEALPNNRAYLDGCLMVTAFKTTKYLQNIKMVARGIGINCNAGAVVMDKKGSYGQLNVWYIPNGIVNIFSMHKLEKQYRITYNSWVGFYTVHTPRGVVKFEQGLPYINLDWLSEDTEIMLIQVIERQGAQECKTEERMYIQTVRGNCVCFWPPVRDELL
jgi:hypothetical protein